MPRHHHHHRRRSSSSREFDTYYVRAPAPLQEIIHVPPPPSTWATFSNGWVRPVVVERNGPREIDHESHHHRRDRRERRQLLLQEEEFVRAQREEVGFYAREHGRRLLGAPEEGQLQRVEYIKGSSRGGSVIDEEAETDIPVLSLDSSSSSSSEFIEDGEEEGEEGEYVVVRKPSRREREAMRRREERRVKERRRELLRDVEEVEKKLKELEGNPHAPEVIAKSGLDLQLGLGLK